MFAEVFSRSFVEALVAGRSCRRIGVSRGAVGILVALAVLILPVLASSGAMAQNGPCGPLKLGSSGDLNTELGAAVASANALAATINATNSAFLTHSTAFVSAPDEPAPNSQGGGIWVRGLGGQDTYKQSGAVSANFGSEFVGGPGSVSSTCNTTFKQSFAGFQIGGTSQN
jgi:hypothetical protein